MPRVVVIGQDRAVSAAIASELEASPAVDACRTVRFDHDPGSLTGEGFGVFVLVPEGSRGLPDAAAAARRAAALRGADQVVLVSSAAVNEPNAHHPGMASEERLPSQRRSNALASRWRELESRVGEALAGTGTVLTVLRPAALLVGGGRGFWSRFLGRRLAPTVVGFDPTVQLLSGADLAAAVRRSIESRDAASGVFNVAPAAAIPLAKALEAARTWRLPLPYWALFLWRKVVGAPVAELDYLRYPWTVSDEKIRRRLGFAPRASSRQAIAALTGDAGPASVAAEHDDFGLDRRYVSFLGKTLFRFLHDFWWRVEWQGLENVPQDGPAVLAGVHRGHQPWDGVMTLHLLARETGRYPRFLVHPTLVKFPFLTPYMTRCGGIVACRENAERVLADGEIAAIFPEGIRGAFRKYEGDATYKLGRFGRNDFVKLALRHQVPIVPYVTVGSAEIFPILGRIDWSWWKRYSEWPYFPVTPTMGTVPLPSKWHTLFLEPIHVEDRYPPEAAGDRAVVRELSLEVRRRMEGALTEMLRRRKSVRHGIWHGSIFAGREPIVSEEKTVAEDPAVAKEKAVLKELKEKQAA